MEYIYFELHHYINSKTPWLGKSYGLIQGYVMSIQNIYN